MEKCPKRRKLEKEKQWSPSSHLPAGQVELFDMSDVVLRLCDAHKTDSANTWPWMYWRYDIKQQNSYEYIGGEPALYQLPTCERIFKLELIVSNKTYPGGLFKLEFSFSIEMMQASLS